MNSDLSPYLQPADAPVSNTGGKVPWKFGMEQKLQYKQAKFTRMNVKNFVVLSNAASASGAIGNGTTLTLSTALSPNVPHQNDINFAIPFVAIYQGTTQNATFQIYPICGGSITPGAYTVQGDFDYQAFSTAIPQTNSVWKGNITDNSAGNQTITFITQWKYCQYNSGTVT